MATLQFSLTPEAINRFRDAIICLGKFNESVGFEATDTKLVLHALNSGQTGYVGITLSKASFFSSYSFIGEQLDSIFTCHILVKTLLSVFPTRLHDARGRERQVEKCVARLEDRLEGKASRLVVQLICKHGVKKTYRLHYEESPVDRSRFDKDSATNKWKLNSHTLAALDNHFGTKTEHLEIANAQGRVTFKSFTDKITDGREILQYPVQTSIALETYDFEQFDVEEGLTLHFPLRDFRGMLAHATSLRATIAVSCSVAGRPIQFTYGTTGMSCEMIAVTAGNISQGSAPAVNRGLQTSVARTTAPAQSGRGTTSRANGQLQARGQQNGRTSRATTSAAMDSPPPPQSTIDDGGLFLSDREEEGGPTNYGETGEADDEIGWAHQYISHPSLQDSGASRAAFPAVNDESFVDSRVAPTQDVAKIRGLFD